MPNYLAPGVYIEEVPSAIQPIAGVSTSVAGFIGIIPNQITTKTNQIIDELVGTGDGNNQEFVLQNPAQRINGIKYNDNPSRPQVTIDANDPKKIKIEPAPANEVNIKVSYILSESSSQSDASNKDLAKPGEVKLCTSFSEFKKYFVDFDQQDSTGYLINAVFGFFNNGGSQCYVVGYPGEINAEKIKDALNKFLTIDSISIIVATGITDSVVQEQILNHCEKESLFAILDTPENATKVSKLAIKNSNYGAVYYPWIKIANPIPNNDKKEIYVPPSGHIAGVYARVDSERGVFKAPANEVIRGALDVKEPLTSADQGLLNPTGLNVIRVFNNTVKIWGARTIGGDRNGEFKYISTRRLYNFLRKSIEQGIQFAVFEPNTPSLWQRITQNVSDFLLGQWRDGALFGDDPKKAFFVKCDAETNPSDVRERGEVITEIGVAIVKPAEFVIFKIQQITGG